MLLNMGACPFCGGGNNTPCFATYDNGYFCYTCGKKKSTDRDAYAFRPSLITSDKNMLLPECTQNTCEFSPSVLKWLYSYYVYDDLIKKYNIAYCPFAEFGRFKGESLILPVVVDGELINYQRRFFPNKQFITKGDKTSPLVIMRKQSNTVVLVEDYISAIRLGEHVNVICLHGVHVSYNVSKLLSYLNMNIEIWLDPDEAGKTASKDIMSQLVTSMNINSKYRAFAVRESISITMRSTEKQPKDYSPQELKKILGVRNDNIKTN